MVSPDQSRFSRRKVSQFAGLVAGIATFPTACRAITTQADQVEAAAAPRGSKLTMALPKLIERLLRSSEGYNLLQPDGVAGKSVFLKPNYNTADPAPAATDTRFCS